jgi:prepilin-type N-terminal cleavage/methylation domain-containing protein
MNLLTKSRLNANRRGFTLTELLVAATLLVSIFSVVTPLAVRSGRIRQETHRYQIALDELSNQLDRLTAIDEKKLADALDELVPSPQAESELPSPELTAEIIDDADGRRLILRLTWDRPAGAVPLTLVGWLDPTPGSSDRDAAKELAP